MEGDTSTWVNLLYSWAPVLVMVGFWFLFMRRLGWGQHIQRQVAMMDRQVQLLERIAVALEQRNAQTPAK